MVQPHACLSVWRQHIYHIGDLPALLPVVITLCPHDRFVEATYKEFRQHTLEEAAMAAARRASVSKLMLLCERHPRRLIPGMLTLLACLPETVATDSYSHLLTLVSCANLTAAVCLLFCRCDCASNLLASPQKSWCF